jgi:ribosomal protein S27AE
MEIQMGVTKKKLPKSGPVMLECAHCGTKKTFECKHYDVVACGECGFIYWVLQPTANGDLKFFPWPGKPEPTPKHVIEYD